MLSVLITIKYNFFNKAWRLENIIARLWRSKKGLSAELFELGEILMSQTSDCLGADIQNKEPKKKKFQHV